MFAPGIPEVLRDFNSSSLTLGGLVVSIYVLGYAAGPIIVAPMSELYGRSPVYHVSNVLFIIFTIACAVSSSLSMLIVFRFFEGVAGSTVITIGGGTVADLFIPEERGKAMAIWSMGPLLGPVIGPVAGGFLAEAEGWRWVFWVITIAVGVALFDPRAPLTIFAGWSSDRRIPLLPQRNLSCHHLEQKDEASAKRDWEPRPPFKDGHRLISQRTV